MKNKKSLIILLVIILFVLNIQGCILENNKKYNYKIGMITVGLGGGLGDKSFNDLCYEGLLKVKEKFGVKVNVVYSKNKDDNEKDLSKLSKKSDLTYALGYMIKDSLEKVAKDNRNKNFVLIDEKLPLQNVKSITFKEEEGSFLMGVIAGKMTKTNKVGFIGGMEVIQIQRFKSGYISGVRAVNPKAAEYLINKQTIKYVGNFIDERKGYDLSKELYEDGCDIIFQVAGGAGIGVFKAAKETKKWAIGVDKDQAKTIPEYKNVILSSMLKNVDKASYDAAIEDIQGNFKGGLDNALELGLKDGGVGVAPSTDEIVPKEVIDLVNKYKKKIINGNIRVPKTPMEAKDFKVSSVN